MTTGYPSTRRANRAAGFRLGTTATRAYSHYTAIFVLVAQAAWAGWTYRDRIRPAIIASLAAAILHLPWVPSLHGSGLAAYAFLEPLTAGHALGDILHPVAGYPYAPLSAIPTVPGLIVIAGCGVLGIASLIHDCGPAPIPRARPLRSAHLSRP